MPGRHNAAAGGNDDLRTRAARLSRYASRLLETEPGLLPAGSERQPFTADQMRAVLAAAGVVDEAGLQRALRTLRKRVMLRLIVRDLGGLAPLDEVMTGVSALADVAVTFAADCLEKWLAESFGEPVGEESGLKQRLHVVGMGKLGGRELNVSSDIDLIFVYPEEGETRSKRSLSNHEFFARVGQRLVAALDEMTADGFVFRVDVRLRPWGDSGPLVCGFPTLENYFFGHGREWERYAWIKGRLMRGDRGADLEQLVQPFVYRRHLDYSAFESLRDLHRQVRHEVERRDILDNIKLGPGGIREIEFIAQLFQLVRGGRDNALRERPTLAILPLLADRRLLSAAAVDELTTAYVFLRNLEHRLQYLDDEQTQTLPASAADRALIADSMGCSDYRRLGAQLERHRTNVTRHFEGIFAASTGEDEEHPLAALWLEGGEPSASAAQLGELGFHSPRHLLERIATFRASSRVQQMPETSRQRMKQLVPQAIAAAARQREPDAACERLLQLLESISRREVYLALLLQYPHALDLAARIVGASPWVADYLARYPILLDELLDARTLYAPPEWPRLAELLRAQLDAESGDIERQMDLLRHFKHSQSLRLIAQDLAGEMPVEQLADHLTDLADIILSEVLRVVWAGLRGRHCDTPHFAVIAYGKLGGKELGYASDLDVIFLYRDPAAEAMENYVRLAQRLNNWLTSMTPAGVLYETDLRLRPDGTAGLLVSSIDGFADYQRGHAWVWEHQALTRARFAAGDREIGADFESLRKEILCRQRNLAGLRSEVVAMRQTMHEGHANASGLFDLKHDPGGLVDVEFIVQYLVLGYSSEHAELTGNIGNLALLKLAARIGLIPEDEALAAHQAYRRFRQLQHALRLQGEKHARVEPAALAKEAAAVRALWEAVLGP
jgi:glutamate-ammonia-ligase adenylyltransferase